MARVDLRIFAPDMAGSVSDNLVETSQFCISGMKSGDRLQPRAETQPLYIDTDKMISDKAIL